MSRLDITRFDGILAKTAVQATVLGACLLCFFTWFHSQSPQLVGVDGYFHIRFAELLRTEGLVRDFRWLPFTLYSRDFADDHFLFHVALIPFTFDDLIAGAKLYATLSASAVFATFFCVLRSLNIRGAWVWTIGLAVASEPFLARMSLARAPSLSVLFLLLATAIVLRRRDRWLGPLSFLFVWLYGGFPLIWIPVGIAFAATLITEKRYRWSLLTWCAAGMALGLLTHPYFPNNIAFLYKSYTQIELGAFTEEIQAGAEDYPYSSRSAVRNALLVWIVTFLSIVPYLFSNRKLKADTTVLFLISIVTLCLYLYVRRFIEYWAPFAFLFSAAAIDPLTREADWMPRFRGRGALAGILLAGILGVAGLDTVTELLKDQAAAHDNQPYRRAAGYLAENTPEDAIVFTSQWAEFPLLYCFNVRNRYVVGLGPHYLYLYDSDLYKRWVEIAGGGHPSPGKAIRRHFNAAYAFTLRRSARFAASMDADPDCAVIYEDEDVRIYRIGEAAGEESTSG